VLLRAGSLTDVEAYLYEKVLRPSAIVKDVPAGAAALPVAPDSVEAFKARLAEIDKVVKPYDDTPDEYMAGLKAGLKQELKSSWKNTF
jgi:hypothetical protein